MHAIIKCFKSELQPSSTSRGEIKSNLQQHILQFASFKPHTTLKLEGVCSHAHSVKVNPAHVDDYDVF